MAGEGGFLWVDAGVIESHGGSGRERAVHLSGAVHGNHTGNVELDGFVAEYTT